MPFYDYTCESCGKDFSLNLPMGKGEKGKPCPHCKSTDTRRIFGANVATKGSCGPNPGRFT